MSNINDLLKKSGIEHENLIEEWRPIIGFKRVIDNLYEVSNYGEVRDIKTKELRNKSIATKLNHSYYKVSLKHHGAKFSGSLEWVLVHQLVAHCFIPVPENLKKYIGTITLVVDHKDNNGLNNMVTNLQWVTRGTNNALSRERADCHHRNKRENDLDFNELHIICKKLADNEPYKDIINYCNMDYNANNIKFLRNIAAKKSGLDCDTIIEKYGIKFDENFTANSSRPTPQQNEIAIKLPNIRDLIKLGKTNGEIVDELWPELKDSTRKSRVRTVRLIREGVIYQQNKTLLL